MASEKPNEGDNSSKSNSPLRSNEELKSFHPLTGASDGNGIDNVPVPYYGPNTMYRVHQPNEHSFFPVTGIDTSQLNVTDYPETSENYLNVPVSDFQPLVWNANEFGQDNALGAPVASADIHANDLENSQITGTDMARGLQMSVAHKQGHIDDILRGFLRGIKDAHARSTPVTTTRELGTNSSQLYRAGVEASGSNISRHSAIENQFVHAGTLPKPGHTLTSGELEMNDNTSVRTQSTDSEVVDSNFLTLGIGSNMEIRSEGNASSKDSDQSTNRIVLPIVNTSSGQNIARSSLNSSSNMPHGFSDFQNYSGGFSRLAPNERLHQTQNLYSSLFSSLRQQAGAVSLHARNIVRMQNAGGFPSQMQNAGVFSHQAQNIDRSSCLLQNVGGSHTAFRNESGQNMSLPANNQSLHIPTRLNSGIGEERAVRSFTDPSTRFQGFPTNSSMLNISNQVGVPITTHLRTTRVPSSSFSDRMAPDQIQKPNLGAVRNSLPEPSSVSPFSEDRRNSALQNQSGQDVQSNQTFAAQVSEGGPLCKNVRVQPASKGQDIPAVNSTECSISRRPTRKRAATTSPSNPSKARGKISRSDKPSCHLSATALPQTGLPDALVSPINSSSLCMRPPPPRISFHLRSPPKTSPPHHIKYQVKDEKRTLKPSGYKCCICKRDLSFTPDGPIVPPEKPIPVAVLPCGHYFHDSCLQRITPENQGQDPPCIPCAMGDKD